MPVTDWVSIAREGATTDGRKISSDWISQMAANYDPKEFGARIDLEHIRSYDPESLFRIYGDVLELKAEDEGGKLFLKAKLDVTDDYVELNKKRQKVFTSIEIDPDFSDTGECYLVGLAFTDDPASLGTEMIKFCSNAKSNPLKNRKQKPENFISESHETELKFMTDKTKPNGKTEKEEAGLLAKVKALFSSHEKQVDEKSAKLFSELEQTLVLIVEKFNGLEEKVASFESLIPKEEAPDSDGSEAPHENTSPKELPEFTKLKADFEALQEKFNNDPAPNGNGRKPSTGGGIIETEF